MILNIADISMISNADINNATVKECMIGNIAYLYLRTYKTVAYINELKFIENQPFSHYEQFKAGNNIVTIIRAFKDILVERDKSFLKNRWGINTEEITKEITSFEKDFEEFYKNLDQEVIDEFDAFRKKLYDQNYDLSDCENDTISSQHTNILYAYNLLDGILDKTLAFDSLYKSHIKQYEDLKYKIYNAATKNENQYMAELRVYANRRTEFLGEELLNFFIKVMMYFTQESILSNCKHAKKGIKTLKDTYKEFIQKKDLNVILKLIDNLPEGTNDLLASPSTLINNNAGLIPYIQFFCTSSYKYIYALYHVLIYLMPVYDEKCVTGKLLYDGYIKWCKENKIAPVISIPNDILIEYPTNDKLEKQHHFPKKRFIDNPLNSKREELNKAFLRKLLKGMVEEKIIDHKTKEEHFFFIFGYGEDTVKDFKAIEILKSDTNYKRENGKRTILFLLKELMGYSDDEIRPKIGKNRHLIINFCFKASSQFKSSDFGEKTVFKASETMKANELLKMKKIYDTALNDTKETVQ